MVNQPPTSGYLASAEGDAINGVNPDVAEALDIARELAAAGIPVFVAAPDPSSSTGFALPTGWQHTRPDPSVVDRWRPGMALCAVMGCGLDLIDVDPRNGGDPSVMNGSTPRSYGAAATPSGGLHSFIVSTGSGSRDNVFPGIDVKSGEADGSGRGFAFLAPTVRPSKVTGEPAAYRWLQPPDVERLARVLAGREDDPSGRALAQRIREVKSEGVTKVGGPDWWREFVLSREPQSQAAAERAITDKLEAVRTWTPQAGGGFRDALLTASFTLGGYVGGGYVEEDTARRRLEEAVEQVWGTPDDDDRLWITQGLTDGAAQPFHVYTAADELAFSEIAQASAARTGGAGEPPWNVYAALGTEPFDPTMDGTDQGLAEAVAQRVHPALRFAVDAGTWIERRREVWREREDMSGWAISTVARLMPLGDPDLPKSKADYTEQHWRHVRRQRFMDSGGAGKVERKLRSIVRGADHPLAVELADLDADPEVLWAGGQAWDLRASAERPVAATETRGVRMDVPHLHTASCAPLEVATPHWDRFVAAVFPDPALRAWALRVLSVALAGYPDAVLPVLYGPERTGKTALVQLIVRVLGTYGHAADPRLLAGADNAHASVVYALKGRRLSFIDEGPRRGHLATERLKQLTGGGSLTGNAMRANPITFLPTHTLVMTTNDEPPITDPALRARMRIIPCEADKAEVRAARQAITEAVWHAESPGVLAALMRECAAWIVDPDTANIDRAPAYVLGAIDEMAASQDPVGEWVENCTLPADPGTPSRELYRKFVAWHEVQPMYRRQSPPSETAFGRSLTDLGFPWGMGGPKGNTRVRPLSVLNGPGMPAPWEPQGGLGAPRVDPMVPDGSEPEPSEGGNPSSTPVFSSSSEGSEGSYRTNNYNNTHTTPNGVHKEKYSGNRRETLDPREPSGESAPSPATTPVPDGRAQTLGSSDQDLKLSTTPVDNSRSWSPSLSVEEDAEQAARAERNRETREAARIADERKISKAEARKLLKEETRLAAVAEVSGESFAFPVAVGRGGAVVSVTVEAAAAQVREAIRRSGALTVDVETSGYPVGHQHYELRTVQLGDSVVAVVFHPVDHAEIISTLLAEAPKLHAHSATADLVPLEYAGLLEHIGGAEQAWARMHDTVIPAKLADPASTGSDPGLKELSTAVLGHDAVSGSAETARKAVFAAGKWLENTKVDTPPERSGWAQIDSRCSAMVRYAAADVLDTGALARALPPIPEALAHRERLAQRMVARVTHRGLRIDHERVGRLSTEHTAARAEIGARLREMLGVANPGSDKQIATALLGLGAGLPISEKGNPSVAEAVLTKLIANPETAEEIRAAARTVLDYRHHDTVLGTFLEPYRVLCEIGDGRARPTVYTLGTDTGRMSCVRPNIQQLPREGGIRALILADPGQLMIGADFSGVEIRVAAALSQDPTLLAFLAEGRDLHMEVAKQVWGPEAGKAERYVAKRIVFGRLYGGGVPTLAAQAGVSESIGASVVDVLDALTPGLSAWSQGVRQAVKQGNTQYRSYSGRIIHLPREYPHKAPNYCIQGTARELLIDALVRWADTRWGTATVIPVHDELDAFVPAEEAQEATAELVRCMETEIYGVPIVADPSEPSPFWQDSV